MMNPAGVLFPVRDEDMADASELRVIPHYSMSPRKKEKPIVILNKDWRPHVFLGWGDDDGDD
jgi:hypothetical protein